MGVEVADAGEEDLAVDPEAGTYLHELRNLLELRGEWIAGREDGRDGEVAETACVRMLA